MVYNIILTVGFTNSCPMTVNMRERPTGVHTAEQRELTSELGEKLPAPNKANSKTPVVGKCLFPI